MKAPLARGDGYMRTGRLSRELSVILSVLVSLVFCASVVAQTGIAVRDTWKASGKLILEGEKWRAVFSKQEGALLLSSGATETLKVVPLCPAEARTIISCNSVNSSDSKVTIKASFSDGNSNAEGEFAFDQKGVVQLNPSANMKGMIVVGNISFGLIPSPALEDLIYDPADYKTSSEIFMPSENIFMGLMKGEKGVFFCAWPQAGQEVELLLGENQDGAKTIKAFEIELHGNPVYLRMVGIPGIWHEEKLLPGYLGKDTELDWEIPFEARWKTDLLEGSIMTSFPFRTERDRIWRPNFGFYTYPVWLEDRRVYMHLGKKVPPKGRAICYAAEGNEDTPLVFARDHLGNIPTIKPKERLHRYPEDCVGLRNCDGRAVVKWLFKLKYQTRERDMLQEAMSDFIYSINKDAGRLTEYEIFMPDLKKRISQWLGEQKDGSASKPFLTDMQRRAEELEREYWDKMDNSPAMDHLKYETEVINKLKVVIDEDTAEVYPEACFLLDEIQLWSDIESVPGRVGGLLREMFQKAGYDCAQNANAIQYSENIRKLIRAFLTTSETNETIY